MSEKNEWKSIDSAPKDGSRVLIWGPDYYAPITAQWYGSEGWKLDSDLSPFWMQPTHWMPLPAAPGSTSSAPGDAQDERQAFEAWAVRILSDNPTWRESGPCELAWQAWQARASVSAPAAGDALDAAADAALAAQVPQQGEA